MADEQTAAALQMHETITITCTRNGASWTLPMEALHRCASASMLGMCVQGMPSDDANRYLVYTPDTGTLHLLASEQTASHFVETVLGIYHDSDVADALPPKSREFIMTTLAARNQR
jgi:hypothetical protein